MNKINFIRLIPRLSGTRNSIIYSKKLCHTQGWHNEQLASPVEIKRHFGQPTPSTHPHLLKTGELTPGLTCDEFRHRRIRLIEAIAKYSSKLGINAKHHVVVVPSAKKLYMSEKIPYIFHQGTDFLYLTGFKEPDSVLVLTFNTDESVPFHRSFIFVPRKDSHSELWEGPKTGTDGAIELLGVDEAFTLDRLRDFIDSSINAKQHVMWYDDLNPLNPEVHGILQNIAKNNVDLRIESPKSFLHQLRLIKSSSEIALMQQSCQIGSESFVRVMRLSKPDISEHELHATMEHECKIRGAEYLAYPPVVAGGNRATIIHYINNNQRIADGELVLMDAGCYYHGYISDITRTWPVSGTFTKPQRILYDTLLEVQLQLLELCKNRLSLDRLFLILCHLLGKKLQEIGIIPPTVSPTELVQVAQQFCPHHVGHYFGMDVHDCSQISRNIELKPGMTITVEPGIYINENAKHVAKEFRGIGIRIEDNVLITDSGYVNLTEKCPKEAEELENIVSSQSLES